MSELSQPGAGPRPVGSGLPADPGAGDREHEWARREAEWAAERAALLERAAAAEAGMRRAELRFRDVFEQFPHSIQLFALDGTTTAVNPAYERLWGYGLDGLADFNIRTEPQLEPIRHLIECGFAGETVFLPPVLFDGTAVAASKSTLTWPRWIQASHFPIRDVDGRVSELMVVHEDVTERKLAEDALIESERAYRTIFQHSTEGIWVHDAATGAMIDVNDAGCEMYGYDKEEMLRLGHAALLYPGTEYTAERVAHVIDRARSGETPRFEWMGRRKDGTANWGEVTLRRLMVGGRDLILATVRDIGARKEVEAVQRRTQEELERRVAERTAELAEANLALEEEVAEHEAAREQLLERSSELEGIFRALPDLYFRTDADGTVLDFRAGEATRLVLSPDAFLGRRLQDVLPPDISGQIEAALEQLALTAELVTFEYTIAVGEEQRDFEARFVPLGVEQVIIVVRDVTERTHAERAVRASEEHFRRLIENSNDQLLICDRVGAITYIGPSIRRLLGYAPDEMIGRTLAELVHPEDVNRVVNGLEDVARNPGMVLRNEYRVRHRDGGWRVFENVARTLMPDSADAGIVANGRDITERRAAEEALREATAAAEHANRAKSEFLSRMSHELRTPMNSILGFAQVLEAEDLPARQERCVMHILRAGRHLLKLINEVLEISRIEAGGAALSLEPVRLGTVLHEAIGLARPMAAQSQVSITFDDRACAQAFVHADRQRLSQVLLNLLSNAIKYNRPGGRVLVDCGPAGEDGCVVVRVQDTGRGIPADRQAELFTPFARLGAENSEVEGTGLGLALSRRLADSMGGRLVLERSDAGGSVFAVELLATQSPLDRMEENGGGAGRRGPVPHDDATLLYIEDNLANLTLVETILWERPNWKTVPALQGQIGIDLAREHLPDLILLDLHLPDMRGEEVLRRLQEEERTAGIPVVIISADATRSTADRLLAAGAAAFLSKPLDVGEFLTTVQQILGRRAGGRSSRQGV